MEKRIIANQNRTVKPVFAFVLLMPAIFLLSLVSLAIASELKTERISFDLSNTAGLYRIWRPNLGLQQ